MFPSSVVKSLLQAWRPTRLVSDRFPLQQPRRLSRHCHCSCTGFLFSARSLSLSTFQYCVIFAAAPESLLFLLLLFFLHRLLLLLFPAASILPASLSHSQSGCNLLTFFLLLFKDMCHSAETYLGPCAMSCDTRYARETLKNTFSCSLLKCNFLLKRNCSTSTTCICHIFFFFFQMLCHGGFGQNPNTFWIWMSENYLF